MNKDINGELKKAENIMIPESLSEENIKARLKEEKPLEVKRNTASTVRRIVASAAVFALVITTLVIAKPWDGHVKVPAGEPTGQVDVPGSDSYEGLEKLFITYYKANRPTFAEGYMNKFYYSDDLREVATAEGALVGGSNKGNMAPQGAVGTAGSGLEAVASPAHGETNEQVEGVSEADIIKNDGKYLYVVRNNYNYYDIYNEGEFVVYGSEGAVKNENNDPGMAGVFIIEPGENGEMEIIGKISVDIGENADNSISIEISNIYVAGDTLIAIGTSAKAGTYNPNTLAVFYDITDRTAPREISRFYQSGDEISTRLTGGRLYIITNHYVDMTESETEMKKNCIPMTGTAESSMARVPSQNICVMKDLTAPSYLVVTSLDIASPDTEPASAAILGGGNTIYCNTERLYVMSAQYNYRFVDTFVGGVVPEVIEDADSAEAVKTATSPALALEGESVRTEVTPVTNAPITEVESEQTSEPTTAEMPATETETQVETETQAQVETETQAETQPEAEPEAEEPVTEFTFGDGSTTAIYSFDITDGAVKYLANGKVPGTVLNQFSADEYDGYFRIATTTDGLSGRESVVSVLNDKLETVGQLSNLGAGETIQSVRFMGARGYVVTFLQTDPLFVIDLSTPTAPALLGELKLPGFSSYLHPVSSTLLIGIGPDGDDDGTNGGLKVSLFDVSDPSKPVEADKYTVNDSGASYVYSDAYYDAKAICWDGENAIFYFPYTVQKYYSNGYQPYDITQIGALKVNAAEKRFGTKTEYVCDFETETAYYFSLQRVTYIGSTVYGFGSDCVISFARDTAVQLATIDLTETEIGVYTEKK